jgi:protein-L-isoaspartate(D-aspartate) O-methyltransferase
MIDSARHQGMRRKLVDKLRAKGIRDESVLEAMLKVPRHLFFESGFLEYAYEDNAFPIAAGQTISQPYTVAFQTELLEVQPGMRVLEVGTGSGYQGTILCEMGAKLYTIERIHELFHKAKLMFRKMNHHPKVVFGDGYKGLPEDAPFDRIIVTAGAREIPPALLDQLKVGGIMVIPVGNEEQEMIRLIRKDEQNYEKQHFGGFRFVPMLEGKI